MRIPNLLRRSSRHERFAERFRPSVARIAALEPAWQRLSDGELREVVARHRGQTEDELRRHQEGIFAAVREAARRTLKMRHFDVQIMGGLALLDDAIAEMKTGEGKTLVATLPLTFRALAGKGAHLVTVNDYLSQRDAAWMAPVYEYFGLTVGKILPGQPPEEKRAGYAADITYGTNNEFGFDYLRDNMATRPEHRVQRDLHYAIVDEVDSILIDEARTPLIISAPDTESTKLYQQFARLVPTLVEGQHYNVDEKRQAVTLTDDGISRVEQALGVSNIYAEQGIRMVHHIEQALRAHALYRRDSEYVVRDGRVVIVDEFTGRLMEGRRYAEGLHQAIEAKEGVTVQQESRTLATITFQNYFRLYHHLSGMTGTAVTSAEEFEKVYNLDVVVIATNKPLTRLDRPDRIYLNETAKFTACVEEIARRHAVGQPVLVGTIAIEKSEHLSRLLQAAGVPHEVLNAKHHEREAEIISQAGQRGAVTISTNMAGRGTDIKLGFGVTGLGGLFVLGTERHEARRIDNQLRGRSGRQGDRGESQFFVAMDDNIMRVFGGERMQALMHRLRVPENEAIENRLVSRALERAQERVEGFYFDMRKQVLSYDNVLNKQRDAIYTLRRGVLLESVWKEPGAARDDLHHYIEVLVAQEAETLVAAHTGEGRLEDWNIEEIAEVIQSLTGTSVATVRAALDRSRDSAAADGPDSVRTGLAHIATTILKDRLHERITELSEPSFRRLEQAAALRAIDTHWMEHLDTMEYLRTGIGLRGYGQRDPLVEYQKEGFRLFQQLLGTIKSSIVEVIFKAQAIKDDHTEGHAEHPATPKLAPGQAAPAAVAGAGRLHNAHKNLGRNDPCFCGATKPDGTPKKFKHCHGRSL